MNIEASVPLTSGLSQSVNQITAPQVNIYTVLLNGETQSSAGEQSSDKDIINLSAWSL